MLIALFIVSSQFVNCNGCFPVMIYFSFIYANDSQAYQNPQRANLNLKRPIKLGYMHMFEGIFAIIPLKCIPSFGPGLPLPY